MPGDVAFPVEPMYDLRLVAELMPCAVTTLQQACSRYRHELSAPLYRFTGYRRRRVLTATDVMVLRGKLIRRHFRYPTLTGDKSARVAS